MKRFLRDKAIIGMIHVLPLPGSPLWGGSLRVVINRARKEFALYREAGIDAVMIENMHDRPYCKPPLERQTVEAMAEVARNLRFLDGKIPIGIQMLEAANVEAIEIAATADLDFVRAEGYVYAHIGGCGIIEGSARSILNRRRELGAEHIKVLADVKKKHCAHALTADISLTNTAKQAEFFLADGIIVTGDFTGLPTKAEDVIEARKATELPLFVGSGVTPDNFGATLQKQSDHNNPDGFIVGSFFKRAGFWENEIEIERVRQLVLSRNSRHGE